MAEINNTEENTQQAEAIAEAIQTYPYEIYKLEYFDCSSTWDEEEGSPDCMVLPRSGIFEVRDKNIQACNRCNLDNITEIEWGSMEINVRFSRMSKKVVDKLNKGMSNPKIFIGYADEKIIIYGFSRIL
jgi:hypothetical protein